jgi:hypothetical protein
VPTDIDEIEAWTLQRVISTATALADSGQYHDFTDIDYALRFEHGWIQARALIDEAAMRMLLNQRCAKAREAGVTIGMPEPAEPQASAGATTPQPAQRIKPSLIHRLFGFRARFARPVGAAG